MEFITEKDRIYASDAAGNMIAETCSYAVIWFARHPEYPLECSGAVACMISKKH